MDGNEVLGRLLVLRMDVERVCQKAVLESQDAGLIPVECNWDAIGVELERIAYGVAALQVELREVNTVGTASRVVLRGRKWGDGIEARRG